MKSKIFIEENRTIKIYVNDDDNTIIEILDYKNNYQSLSVNLKYIDYDFYMVVNMYKDNLLMGV